jgi:DNA (cytosine-5)-methyltransferase 1
VVEPFILSQHAGGAARAVAEPMPGMTCGGAHALIAPYYTHGSGQSCSGTDQPLPTVTTKARFALVMPVTHGDEQGRYRSPWALRPGGAPIVTGAHRVDLQPTGSSRGELACIIAAFGERKGQVPRVHSVDEPAPTICAQGRVQLVEPIIEGGQYDIRFRMLEPKELARAMGFSDAETAYEFAGNKTEITKQIQCRPRQSRRRTGWRLDAELKSAAEDGRAPSNDGSREAASDQKRLINTAKN